MALFSYSNPRQGGIKMTEPYKELANAIIIQAVKDYRRTNMPQAHRELKRFFRSEWFSLLSDIDGEMLIQKLEKERGVKKHGKTKPTNAPN